MEASLSSPTAYLLAPVTVVHPPELETDDSTLATEVLPAPPPLASVSGHRRDTHLKRPSQVFSYLPASDPGSTYSGLMGGLGLSLVPEDEGRLRKRPRVDKTAINNRAQRASARNLTPSIPPPVPSPPSPNPSSDPPIEPPALRRTHSASTHDPAAPKTATRDKGKAKEKPPPRVKEEPQPISLDMLEPPSLHPNNDHCSACRSYGALVYCDGCPRAFHLWCLDPPLDAQDIPEHRWYCPACVIRQNPPPRPRRSLLAPLLHQLQTSIPTEFELPDDIRGFFKDVTTGPKGAYQDSSETKIARSSRFALQDEREPFRLKDKNGAPVLCFRCGKSALPDIDTPPVPNTSRETRGSGGRRALRAPPGEVLWKSIVSCDRCTLHWHLDCLDPPLASMPPTHKKWMCPAHVEHIAPKRRVPRQVPPVTDVTERNRPNNGNIEIIPADSGTDKTKKMAVDEVHINGRRYRVPERVIVLDFWDKLERGRRPVPTHGLLSGLSSPLTSLSSLDGIGPSTFAPPPEPPQVSPDPPPAPPGPDPETMRAVELLFGCRTAVIRDDVDRMDVDPVHPMKSDIAVQTDPEGCVKLDVTDAKQLSGLISATLHDLDRPKSSSPSKVVPRPRVASTPRVKATRPPRPARTTPASGSSPRKSSRLPSDSGSTRVTRSKVAPPAASAPAASSSLRRPKTETSSAPIPAPETRTPSRTTRSTAASAAIPPLSETPPVDVKRYSAPTLRRSRPSKSSMDPPKPPEPSESPIKPLKSEPSGSTVVPPPPPSPTRSPFKIRIPSAINTAVAAATAAAAAASASASSTGRSQPTERPRSARKESDLPSSSSDSDAPVPSAAGGPSVANASNPLTASKEVEVWSSSSSHSDVPGPSVATGVKTYREPPVVIGSNGRPLTAPRASAPRQSTSNVIAATPTRVTRSVTTTSGTPTRPPRNPNPFDRQSPQYTDISDSSDDWLPPGLFLNRGRRYITLPRLPL